MSVKKHVARSVTISLLFIFGVAVCSMAQTTKNQYDIANRLLQTKQADCTMIAYTYDDNGNRASREILPCPVISGSVLTPEGVGIPGVTLRGLPGEPITNLSGYYSVQVESGWSGTIAPQKDNYTFTPVNRVYTALKIAQTAQDFIGVLAITPTPLPTATPETTVTPTSQPTPQITPTPQATPTVAVPEPATFLLLGGGVIFLIGIRRVLRHVKKS